MFSAEEKLAISKVRKLSYPFCTFWPVSLREKQPPLKCHPLLWVSHLSLAC